MNIGMLWFDRDSTTTIEVKIHRAAAYYAQKYGSAPNLAFIHPSMTPPKQPGDQANKPLKAGEIEIRTTRSVLPNHIWIGVNDTHQPNR